MNTSQNQTNTSQNQPNTLDPTMNPASVYFLHPSDTGQKIVSDVFNGVGYGDWKRSMVISLSGKNKLCFVDGTLSRPAENSPDSKAWDRVNNVVIGWLLGALSNQIGKSVLWFKTAREIWQELEERYGQASSAQLFSIQEEVNKLEQQSNESVAGFFTKIKSLWDELDNLDPLPSCSCAGCSCNLTQKFFKIQQNHRVIQFLMKLDAKYAQVRSNLLMLPELPNIAQAYRVLSQEEKHQDLNKLLNNHNESVAFGADKRKFGNWTGQFQRQDYARPQQMNQMRPYTDTRPRSFTDTRPRPFADTRTFTGSKRPNYYCDHCKMNGHSRERCWRLNGLPPDYRPNTWQRSAPQGRVANMVHHEADNKGAEEGGGMITTTLSQEQYKQLQQLMNKSDDSDQKNSENMMGTALFAGPFDETAMAAW